MGLITYSTVMLSDTTTLNTVASTGLSFSDAQLHYQQEQMQQAAAILRHRARELGRLLRSSGGQQATSVQAEQQLVGQHQQPQQQLAVQQQQLAVQQEQHARWLAHSSVRPLQPSAAGLRARARWHHHSDSPLRQAMLNKVLAVLQLLPQQPQSSLPALAQRLELRLYSIAVSLGMYGAAVPKQLMLEQLGQEKLMAQLELQQRRKRKREEDKALLEQQQLAKQQQQLAEQQQQQQQRRAAQARAMQEESEALQLQQLQERLLTTRAAVPLPADPALQRFVGGWQEESDAPQR
jgi:hypothetical protein